MAFEILKRQCDEEFGERKAYKVVFYGHQYNSQRDPVQYVISMSIGPEGPANFLRTVAAEGGIGQVDADGVMSFIPWPCTRVTISPADD